MSERSGASNWLLISVDQWRGDWLHQTWLQLPNLQRMARQGWDVRRYLPPAPSAFLPGPVGSQV